MKNLAVLLVIFCCQLAQASELGGVLKNNAGVKKFFSERSLGAFDDFTGALSDLPYSGAVHFNIGNSFLKNKEFPKALSEYDAAIREAKTDSAKDRAIRFRALFNSAVAETEMQKNDEALAHYQSALDLNPSSVEAKTNMELLSKQQQQQQGGEGEKKDQKDQNKDDKKDKNDDKNKDQNDKNKDDQKNKDQDQNKQKNPDKPETKPSPKPFKSEDLTQQDVKRILEELKRQEEQIRTRMENEQRKTAPPGKDW